MSEQDKHTAAPAVFRTEEKREPMLTLVSGETGVGKTHRNKKEIRYYLKDNPETGKRGRKVLAFDTNDDDYTEYKTVSPEHLHKLTAIRPRRIRPFNKDGNPMSKADKKEVGKKILRHFRNGLIVLDDIDDYMAGEKGQDMISALVGLRHKGVDIMFTHQSIGKITRTEFQACTWLKVHHQVDDVTYIKDRIPKYWIVRIAQLIVDEQYDLAYTKFSKGEISKVEFKQRSSYFVYINLRTVRLRGCSRAAYIRACKKFIDQEQGRKVKMMLQERNFFNDKPIYKNRNQAIVKIIEGYLRFHETTTKSPFQEQ